MKGVFVEYNAYLSYLYKKEENIGKSEFELVLENGLYKNIYKLAKCGDVVRFKRKLPLNTYTVSPILRIKYFDFSDMAYNSDDIIAILVSEEELANIDVPYPSIYELQSVSGKPNYYRRVIDNMYLMEQLTDVEQQELNEECFNYYNQYAEAPIYIKELDEDGTTSLVTLHDENYEGKKYYACDDNYPEEMKSLISYLEVTSRSRYIESELPQKKENNILKRIIKNFK